MTEDVETPEENPIIDAIVIKINDLIQSLQEAKITNEDYVSTTTTIAGIFTALALTHDDWCRNIHSMIAIKSEETLERVFALIEKCIAEEESEIPPNHDGGDAQSA